jgi:uncharacterized membrane protein YcaP (DUF421 family)
MENGQILEDSLKKSKFDINDLLQEARINGYYDLSQINYAIMEANGTISFLPKKMFSNVLCSDINLLVEDDSIVSNVIIDGVVMENNLKSIGKNKKWLLDSLKKMGYEKINDLILVICDKDYKLNVFNRNVDKKYKKVLE